MHVAATLRGVRWVAAMSERLQLRPRGRHRPVQHALGMEIVFALGRDGTLRFLGEAVAKLTASGKMFEPRLHILADEGLTGPARDKVEARLQLWVKAHIEKLLGPLLRLEAGEGIDAP